MNTPTTPQNPDVPEPTDVPAPTDSTAAPEPVVPTEATPADNVLDDSDRTEAIPTGSATQAAPTTSWSTPAAAPAAMGTATATATAPAPAPAPAPAEPEYLRGPAPFALVLGLLGLVVAGSVLVGELTDVSLPWNDLGPWSVVAAGVLVLLVGAIGLRSSRTRD
jgi:hypothetical protein